MTLLNALLETRLVNCYSIQYEIENRFTVVAPGPGAVTGHGGTALGQPSRGWLTREIRADGRCQPKW